MLQPHSLLWHYLWIAPDVLLALLALAMLRRGLHRQFPAFFCYAVFESVGGAIVYTIDVTPSIFSDQTYWWSYLSFLFIEVVVKLLVVGEVFIHLLRRYPALGSFGKTLISGLGILLVFAATIIAAFANPTPFWLISATRILGRSTSLVQCGLIIFVIVFAAHFHLTWERHVFGIVLGFAISGSVYVAHWALMTDWFFGSKSYLMDFLIMATYHVCVLIWCYYLLIPQKLPTTSAVSLPENDLATWNRELERLLGQ
jgi:hypothetical protein